MLKRYKLYIEEEIENKNNKKKSNTRKENYRELKAAKSLEFEHQREVFK